MMGYLHSVLFKKLVAFSLYDIFVATNFSLCSKKMSFLLHLFFDMRKFNTCASNVRVRFAPSPTGLLHLGGLRTALYNYLFAKSTNGKFIFRLEDTDQLRFIENSVNDIQNCLKWANIEPDEGPFVGEFGPYIQSQRKQIYQKYALILLENDLAYYCFCSENRLNLIRKQALKNRQIPRYDNHCRFLLSQEIQKNLDMKKPACIRFKFNMNNGLFFNDLIFGCMKMNMADYEGDFVILKDDGFPTYHFANVIDDHLMQITHILRGCEWITSTPKHIALYQAFKWSCPSFAHLSLLLNSDGSKLSKRQNDMNIGYLMSEGYYPEAVINYLCSLGGGFFNFQQDMTYNMSDLIEKFQLSLLSKHSNRLDLQKLKQYNKLYLYKYISNSESQATCLTELKRLVKNKYENSVSSKQLSFITDNLYLEKILFWFLPRIYSLHDILKDDYDFLWKTVTIQNIEHFKFKQEIIKVILCLLEKMIFKWDILNCEFQIISKQFNIQYSELMQFQRFIITGVNKGPSMKEIYEMLGKEIIQSKLQFALDIINKNI